MRTAAVCLVLIATFGIAGALAQGPPSNSPPDLQIIKYSWSKERIDWERDPLSTPVESYRETTYRIRNERRIGTPLEERANKANREDQKTPTKPPRYAFSYKLHVNNIGTKTIKEIDWDYIIIDDASGEELGRRQFTSVEKINPGKRKELIVRVSAAPSNRISVYSLGKDEHAGLTESVLITRLLYEDGTTLVLSETKEP